MHGNESESYLDERRQQSNWLGPLESSNASLKNRLGDMLSQFDGASLELVNTTDTKMQVQKLYQPQVSFYVSTTYEATVLLYIYLFPKQLTSGGRDRKKK